jgi:hypothetical protein
MSATVGVPPFTAIATDEADGETNAGRRDPDDVVRDGISSTALPCDIPPPLAGALGGVVVPPPPHALTQSEMRAIAVAAIGRCMRGGCDLEVGRPAEGTDA